MLIFFQLIFYFQYCINFELNPRSQIFKELHTISVSLHLHFGSNLLPSYFAFWMIKPYEVETKPSKFSRK